MIAPIATGVFAALLFFTIRAYTIFRSCPDTDGSGGPCPSCCERSDTNSMLALAALCTLLLLFIIALFRIHA